MGAFRAGLLPRVRLSDAAFQARHAALRLVLWVQIPILTMVGVLTEPHGPEDMVHASWAAPAMGGALACCAIGSVFVRGRRLGPFLVSLGLLLAAALLVTLGGGRTELHFAFFLMIGLISLYQDWVPLALSVVLVVLHHLLVGHVAPALLYSDPPSAVRFIQYAAVHGGFVLGCCAVQIVYWRFTEQAQNETDRIRAEADRALRHSAERYEALVQDSSDVTVVVDRSGKIVSVSAAMERVLGHRPDHLVDTDYHQLVHPDDVARLRSALADGREEHRAEVRLQHADGDWRWHEMVLRDMTAHSAVSGWVINHRDVTERRQAQDRLAYEASHDALTGLANRAELLRTLDESTAAAAATDTGIAVLYLDLDHFKQVNDVYGHETGDLLLASVARTLHRCVLGSDTVGRLGGDEFAVVLTQIGRLEAAISVATRVLAELAQPVEINNVAIVPGGSIGIALSTPSRPDGNLLSHADTAMYHAKRDRSGWRAYVAGMHDPAVPVTTLEDDLRDAIRDGQLSLAYQPVVSLITGEITEVEALVRWNHPVRGRLLPEAFLPLAEQSGLIGAIGDWVLAEACAQAVRWPGVRLAVNLSPRQLDADDAADQLLAVLAGTGFDPGDLTVEIAETACVDAPELVDRLTELRGHGVRIALDDFGTGHSSLRHLTRLPVDVLKLDDCFVAELDGTPAGSAVAEAVIRLGRILELDTVAEGVETEAQAAELTLLGCRSGQGFLYSAPLDATRMDELLRSTSGAGTLSG
ncbi:putative bifunctional diguanylate cyclase/phosphodiesterase [Actinoplanes sp. NPDC049265]|uniref:putative bifunctional diguanylate cyclase/phosphodiesterase n=1 Tax=Actinoplanes sp. NPDC049265 TaxID=3363902 RepID=UPI003717A6B0